MNQALRLTELARHVMVDVLVLLPVKLLECLGEARVQLVSRVTESHESRPSS